SLEIYLTGEHYPCGERACPALGCEAALERKNALSQTISGRWFGAAAQPNAGQARSPRDTYRLFYLKTLKGLAVRAEPIQALTAATDMHTDKPPSPR
ncbi:MAG: hypothetical protein ABI463_22535, partial [Pseudomonas sp.]